MCNPRFFGLPVLNGVAGRCVWIKSGVNMIVGGWIRTSVSLAGGVSRGSDDVMPGYRTNPNICAQPIVLRAALPRTRTAALHCTDREGMEGVWVTSEFSVPPSTLSCVERLSFKAAPFYAQGAFQYESVAEAQGMLDHTPLSSLMVTRLQQYTVGYPTILRFS